VTITCDWLVVTVHERNLNCWCKNKTRIQEWGQAFFDGRKRFNKRTLFHKYPAQIKRLYNTLCLLKTMLIRLAYYRHGSNLEIVRVEKVLKLYWFHCADWEKVFLKTYTTISEAIASFNRSISNKYRAIEILLICDIQYVLWRHVVFLRENIIFMTFLLVELTKAYFK
jgi:hypothetical protein